MGLFTSGLWHVLFPEPGMLFTTLHGWILFTLVSPFTSPLEETSNPSPFSFLSFLSVIKIMTFFIACLSH
jgi:hypothetical protein